MLAEVSDAAWTNMGPIIVAVCSLVTALGIIYVAKGNRDEAKARAAAEAKRALVEEAKMDRLALIEERRLAAEALAAETRAIQAQRLEEIAAATAQVVTQTDGMNKQMVALAKLAGEKIGGDEQKARHDVQSAATAEQTEKLVEATQKAGEAKGWDERDAELKQQTLAQEPLVKPVPKPKAKP